ncbi:OLC1v1017312C1 [Oldenlandia corymbosa var. corymbosa]|uniref:OLC1v1017312C1 n=1 Tax=Oldenlandia corymbosa var. corymbosa TaxID=529605 RepID=A0AAV1E941_OLDCO|nr:OLC1v1017312C1 [Oldenlandia corymbosa var. corymbosa]
MAAKRFNTARRRILQNATVDVLAVVSGKLTRIPQDHNSVESTYVADDNFPPRNPPKRLKKSVKLPDGEKKDDIDEAKDQNSVVATLNAILNSLSEISEKLDAFKETRDTTQQSASTNLSMPPPSGSPDDDGQKMNVDPLIITSFWKSDDQILRECVEALNAVEHLSPLLYGKAYRAILGMKDFRKMFLLVPNDRKKNLIKEY